MDEGDIWLGDRLPTIYDVAKTIFHYSKALNSNKRKDVVHRYAVAVRNIWIKSFTEKHVLSLTSVKNRIEKIMKDYENRVRTVHSSNNKGPTSLSAQNKLWMSMDVPKPKTKKGDFKNCKNSSLFDIGRNMETTKDKGGNVVEGHPGNKKLFYDDQRGERHHALSQEIDTEYEAEQLKIQQAEVELEISYHQELIYINEKLEVMPSSSKQKSHTEDRVCKVAKNVQVNIYNSFISHIPSSHICLVRNATYEI